MKRKVTKEQFETLKILNFKFNELRERDNDNNNSLIDLFYDDDLILENSIFNNNLIFKDIKYDYSIFLSEDESDFLRNYLINKISELVNESVEEKIKEIIKKFHLSICDDFIFNIISEIVKDASYEATLKMLKEDKKIVDTILKTMKRTEEDQALLILDKISNMEDFTYEGILKRYEQE